MSFDRLHQGLIVGITALDFGGIVFTGYYNENGTLNAFMGLENVDLPS